MKNTFNRPLSRSLLLAAVFALMIGSFGLSGASTAYAQYYGTPTYNYGYEGYNNYQGPLKVSCYPMPLNASVGQNVTWYASAYGGNGSYNYTWSGDEGLSGYGQSIAKAYSYSGYKNATITVISGGQTVSKNCDASVNVGGSSYVNQTPVYPPAYYPTPYPTPYYPTTYYSPIIVSCGPSASNVNVGQGVTWTAYATGGNGYFTYTWTGTDGLYGSGQSTYFTYANPGSKIATVTVYSNGQSITQSCTNYVTVGYGYSAYPYSYNNYSYNYQTYPQTAYTYPANYTTSNYNGLDIGCYADPTNAKINQPVTWTVEVTGGSQPYTYSWTGSDGLSGSQSSVIKYYSTAGSKSAIVTVTGADGKSASHACSNSLTVTGAYHAPAVARAYAPTQQAYAEPAAQTAPQAQAPMSSYGQTAGLFSLGNVPWGWIAVLVILMLFFTVMYLLFNKQKI